MNCPIDESKLRPLTVERNFRVGIKLDICDACHGVWVDGDELSPLMAQLSSDHEKAYKEWLTATHDGLTAPADFWQESQRVCPRDAVSLQKHYPGLAQGVGVDQCPRCSGCWFDGSELYAIAKLNEPNAALDQAIAGAAGHLRADIADNYDNDTEFWWDVSNRPERIVPYIGNGLLNLILALVVRR